MDLKKFKFPDVNAVDMAFSTFDSDPKLLKEAKARGFYNGHTPYNYLFSQIFFSGGRIRFKPNADKNIVEKGWPYIRAFMRSWSPKHEEKEAICAMIMSEILEPKLEQE
jgi:hypothetical protein